MTNTLIYGSAQSGKSALLKKEVQAFLAQNPHAQAYVILPSRYHVQSSERLFLSDDQAAQHIALRQNFISMDAWIRQLADRIALRKQQPLRTISSFESFLIVRQLVWEDKGFAPQDMPSTAHRVYNIVRDLRSRGVPHPSALEGMHTLPIAPEKWQAITRIYLRYEEALRTLGLMDSTQYGIFLRHELVAADLWGIDCVAFDAFTRFYPGQKAFLEQLALCMRERDIPCLWTLSDYAFLGAADMEPWVTQSFRVERRLSSPPKGHFADQVFGISPQSTPKVPHLTEIHAVNDYRLCEFVANQVHLHAQEGVEFSQMAVLLPQAGSILHTLQSVLRKHQVPFFSNKDELLTTNPLMRFLLDLTRMAIRGISSVEMLGLAEHSYIHKSKWRSLGRLLQGFPRKLHGKAEMWLQFYDDHYPDNPTPTHAQERQSIQSCLEKLFAIPQKTAPMEAYINWMAQLIAELDIQSALAHRESGRDFNALRKLQEELLSAHKIQRTPLTPFAWEKLLSDLLRESRYRFHIDTRNAVQILSAEEANNHSFACVFILQLQAHVFPRHPSRAWVSEEERTHFNQLQGEDLLETHTSQNAQDSLDFYIMLTRADTVYLGYTPVRGQGEVCLPSFFLEQTRAAYGKAMACIPMRPESTTPSEDIHQPSPWIYRVVPKYGLTLASPRLILETWPQLLNQDPGARFSSEGMPSESAPPEAWLREHQGALRDAQQKAQPMLRYHRALDAQEGTHFGQLGDAILPAMSITHLESYGRCAYRFLWEHILRVQPFEWPKLGLPHLEKGGILHQVLERYVKESKDYPMEKLPDISLLKECMDQAYEKAPHFWRQDWERRGIFRVLRNFVYYEKDLRSEGAQVWQLEYKVQLDLPLPHSETQTVSLRIDRIDQTMEGLRITDYKTGDLAHYKADIRRALALFQPFLYTQALASEGYAEFQYVSIEKAGETLKPFEVLKERNQQDIFRQKREEALWIMRRIEAGEFSPFAHELPDTLRAFYHGLGKDTLPEEPSNKCAYCPYQEICRRPNKLVGRNT